MELMLTIDSVELTQQLKQVQNQYLQQSLELGSDCAYQAGQPQEAHPLPLLKQAMVYILYPFVWLIKNLT